MQSYEPLRSWGRLPAGFPLAYNGNKRQIGRPVSILPMQTHEPTKTNYWFDCAQRKPMVAERWSGTAPFRLGVRKRLGWLFHEPPRTLL